MKRFVAGIGSLIALAVVLVGIPLVLVLLAGNPIPSWEELQAAFTRPDYGGQFVLGNLLPIIAWLAWLTFAVSVFTVIPSTIRGLQPPHIPGLGFQQKTAAALLGTIIIMFTGVIGITNAPSANAVTPQTHYSASQDASGATASAPGGTTSTDQVIRAADVPLPLYTVKAGDTLWTIAQSQLGDGKRYNEIAELNYNESQDDGGILTPQNHWVAPGWVLQLPADAGTHSAAVDTAPAVATAAVASTPASSQAGQPAGAVPAAATAAIENVEVTVKPGDTLWGIAEAEYGAGHGDRYPELFNASAATTQPGGVHIEDPNLILPGWDITVPNVPVAAAPAPAPAPAAPAAPTPSAGAAGTAGAAGQAGADHANGAHAGVAESGSQTGSSTESNHGSSTASTAHDATAAADSLVDDIFASPTMTLGGIGGLLAAGVLGFLGIRRYQQRRRRKPGERISMPDVESTATELELRAVEDPQGIDDVDRALRYLASWAQKNGEQLPKLFAVRLSSELVELYLEEPADLPEPFTLAAEDKTAWSVLPESIPEFSPRPTAPYPGLVTLGQDPANGHILIDLEQIGSLNIAGSDEETTEGALTALAIELACSKWADDLQVTIVGFAPELAGAFNTGRIQYVDDVRSLMSSLRGRARAYTQAFEDLQVDGPQQARMKATTDTWTPEIVLLRHLPDEKTQAELVELIERTPRVGIAAITNGKLTGAWSLNIAPDHSATLEPAGISIRAQVVAGAEYQHILTSLAVTAQEAVPAPVTDETATEAARAVAEVAEAEFDVETVTLEPGLISVPGWDFAPTDDGQVVEPETTNEPETVDPTPEAAALVESDEGPLEIPEPTGPIIKILGQIRVEGAKGPEPRTEKTTYVTPATELLVYLALHPAALADDVSEALWPGKRDTATSNRNSLMSRARRWLGSNDADELYLPNVTTSTYSLHPDVPTDWGIWKILVGDDLSKTPTRNLVAAMKLVKQQPFTGAPRRRYAWADSDRQEIIASIVDAAHELAERALSIRDVATARMAAIIGELVDPASEIPVRDRLKAEDLANDIEGFDRVEERLYLHLAEFEEDEPEGETLQLIDELRSHRLAS